MLLVYNAWQDIVRMLSFGFQHDKALHLSSYIDNECNRANIDKAKRQVIYRTDALLSEFNLGNTDVICNLIHIHCLRRVLKLDPITRSIYIPLLIKKHYINIQTLIRCASFWVKCVDSDNSKLKLASNRSI